MKKISSLIIAICLIIGCEASINDEKIFDTHPETYEIENYCGLDMFFDSEYFGDIHERVFTELRVRNRSDQEARLTIYDGIIYPVYGQEIPRQSYNQGGRTFDIFIEEGESVWIYVDHDLNWGDWQECPQSGKKFKLDLDRY